MGRNSTIQGDGVEEMGKTGPKRWSVVGGLVFVRWVEYARLFRGVQGVVGGSCCGW